MNVFHHDGIHLHYRVDGEGAPLVISNSLGTDLRNWDPLLAALPQGLQVIRYDTRGHGLSSCPLGPYTMEMLVADVEALMDHIGVSGAAFLGLSVGGLIGQGLATKRPDLVGKLILSNTAAKIGTDEIWAPRIAAVRADGLASLADATMQRWFSPAFLATPELALWREMLVRTPDVGYVGVSEAIMACDFTGSTAQLTLPAMAIAGSEDGATPPAVVRATADLIPGCRFELMEGLGHIPNVEAPQKYANLVTSFLRDTGHI